MRVAGAYLALHICPLDSCACWTVPHSCHHLLLLLLPGVGPTPKVVMGTDPHQAPGEPSTTGCAGDTGTAH